MKNILMIGTGGTIASGQTADGLAPELDPSRLLQDTPRVAQLCRVDCLQLYSLDSTNIRPDHWLGLARAIRQHYDQYDGFVISHGTDTMAYTAAALSYLIQDCPKPIVLTVAQKPIWYGGTDSKRNLTDAFLYACRGCGGVQIVFNGKVILGTRARKTFSKSFQAFSSVNYPELALIQDERLLQYITTGSRPVFGLHGNPFFTSHAAHFRILESKHNFPYCLPVHHRVGIRKNNERSVHQRHSTCHCSRLTLPERLEMYGRFPLPARLQSFVRTVIASVRHPYDVQLVRRIIQLKTVFHLLVHYIFFVECRNEEGNFRQVCVRRRQRTFHRLHESSFNLTRI